MLEIERQKSRSGDEVVKMMGMRIKSGRGYVGDVCGERRDGDFWETFLSRSLH